MTVINHFVTNTTAVNTTDAATQTTIISWTPANTLPTNVNNCIVSCVGTLIGKSSTNTGVTLKIAATFSIIAGAVTLLGTQTITLAAQGTAALVTSTATFDTSSGDIRLRANGIAATTIGWNGWIEIKSTNF